MKRALRAALAIGALVCLWCADVAAKGPAFNMLAFYSTNVEPHYVHVANDALVFFRELAA